MSTQFNGQKHFYFKLFKQLYVTIQFSISMQFKCKYSLIVKNNFFLSIPFSRAVLIQPIQFSISTDFVYSQLIFKTVLC